MSLPIPFVLGLLVLVSAREWYFVLPGSGNVASLCLCAPLLLVPALLTWIALQNAPGRREPSTWRRHAARLAGGAMPAVYAVVLGPGTWLDLADLLSGDGKVAGYALLLAPLLLAEALQIEVEARRDGQPALRAHRRQRWAFLVLFSAPWLLLATAADVLHAHPATYAFLTATSPGVTCGMLLFVCCMAVLWPLAFRWLFGLSRLPEPLGDELRGTAAALGFPARRVLWLDSGLRTVNALLLGPLPWPRYLVLADGLVMALSNDVNALKGVVAHEVGHAQAGHPAMLVTLFVVVPLLLANPVQLVDLQRIDGLWLVAGGVVLALLLCVVRAVGHRFEHEADVLSAIALGGAEPCIRALVRVGQILQQDPARASLLHPSEHDRVHLLQGFAGDPAFRARFALRGLRLRRAIVGIVIAALLIAGGSWYSSWPVERALYLFRAGDLASAREQAEAVGTQVSAGQWESWASFREDLAAASEIAGPGGDWEQLRPRFAADGWRRGVATLRAGGDSAAVRARAWFALAVEGAPRDPMAQSLLLYCEAARDHDTARQQQVADHVRALGVPAELAPVFGG